VELQAYVDDVHHGAAAIEVPRFIAPEPDEEPKSRAARASWIANETRRFFQGLSVQLTSA
jgi:hypothetical protein